MAVTTTPTGSTERPTAAVGRGSPWPVVVQGAAMMAVGMGVGRFAFTPVLPLMEAQAGLSTSDAATLATANYVGYLVGALLGIVVPRTARSAGVSRTAIAVLVATLAGMALTTSTPVWFVLRLVAGVASALLFVTASSAMLARLRQGAHHLVGWGFGGIGLGIALSGAVVLVLRPVSDWRGAWWGTAALAAALALVAWRLRPEAPGEPTVLQRHGDLPSTRFWFVTLLAAYTLEGVGYIVAGTFLVAAIDQNSPAWLGSSAWVVVGVAALPAAATYAHLSRRVSRPTLMSVALVLQAIGIGLPSVAHGIVAALVSAILFGNTFVAISSLSIAIGAHLQFPHSVALLTAGFSAGQIAGPLVVRPLLHGGYRPALLLAAAVVLGAAALSALLRVRFPHRVGTLVEPVRARTVEGRA